MDMKTIVVLFLCIRCLTSNVIINVCTIICDGGTIPYCIGRSGPALDIGIEKLRQRLPEATVNFYVNRTTGKCEPAVNVGAMASKMYYEYNATVFIGPGKYVNCCQFL